MGQGIIQSSTHCKDVAIHSKFLMAHSFMWVLQIHNRMKEKEVNKETLVAIGSSISVLALETEHMDNDVSLSL